jgi:hypothetical protein
MVEQVGISLLKRCYSVEAITKSEVQMRLVTKLMAALVMAMHYASADSLAATNCGFLTLEQCRATVSGIGGFCVPNQFYNPQRSAKGARKRGEARAYAMPYDPYPWCAEYSEGEK